MNIGLLKRLLKELDHTLPVIFDFGGYSPGDIDSWRGVYAEPAIGYEKRAGSVAGLLDQLEQATDGRKFTGWKGGEYAYNDFSDLHVDNPGECSNTEIAGVLLVDGVVVLSTEYVP